MINIYLSHILAFAANCFWGLMAPTSKTIMLAGLISPLAIINFRLLGSMIIFWILAAFVKYEKVCLVDHFKIMGAAILGICLNQALFILGVNYTSPANAAIITTSMPLWAMILSYFFLKESLTSKKIIGLLIGASGAITLIVSSTNISSMGSSSHALGDILVILAQLSYASYVVFYSNFIKRYSIFTMMRLIFTYAFIFILPFTLTDTLNIEYSKVSINEILSLLYIIFFATFLAQIFIIFAQKNLSPTVTGMYNYIQPTVATIASIILGLDNLHLAQIIAICLVATGVFIVTRAKRHH